MENVTDILSIGVEGIARRMYEYLVDPKYLAKETYDSIKRRVVMAMLVHCCYYRDLTQPEKFAAWWMDYYNERAENYKKCWSPHPCGALESELQKLGLAFFRRNSTSNPNAPDLAIVLRGTIPTRLEDWTADWKIGIQELDHTDRVVEILKLILQVVGEFRSENPDKRICMAGHSLGAAIALIVGGCLYSTYGIDIDTHLFNPPLLTLVDAAKLLLPQSTRTEDTCTFKLNFQEIKQELVEVDERFWDLRGWVPHIYLNPGDPICQQFIRFYKTAGDVRGDFIPLQGLLSGLFLKNVHYLKDVVPSAHLCISTWGSEAKSDRRLENLPKPIKEVLAGILPHSLRQWHKFTEEHIGLTEHHARLLEAQPKVGPPIPDYSALSE